jgi:K+-transporting ATPase KdpF subunit
MLLWVTGGSNVHDGAHAIRDCRFLFFDARSGEIRRGCHRQIATREIARRRSFRCKRESKIPLSGGAFSTAVHSGVAGGHDPKESIMVAVYLLALIVVFLVVYLFYAVINPERF